jgi:hypothetical protein
LQVKVVSPIKTIPFGTMQALCSVVARQAAQSCRHHATARTSAIMRQAMVGHRPTMAARAFPEVQDARRGVSAAAAGVKGLRVAQTPHAMLGVPASASWSAIVSAREQLVMDSLPEYEFDDQEAEALVVQLGQITNAFDALAARTPM